MLTSFVVCAHTKEGVIPSQVSEEESKYKSVKWKKKALFIDRGNLLSFSSSLSWSYIFLSERGERENLLLSPVRLSLPSCLSALLRNSSDSFLADSGLCCSSERLTLKQDTLVSLLHQLFRGLTESPREAPF